MWCYLVCVVLTLGMVDLADIPSPVNFDSHPQSSNKNSVSEVKCPLLNNNFLSELRQQCISTNIAAVSELSDQTRHSVLCDLYLANLNVTCGRLIGVPMAIALVNKHPIEEASSPGVQNVCKSLAIVPDRSPELRKLINSENICIRICLDYSGNVEPLCHASYYLSVDVPNVFVRLDESSQITNAVKKVDHTDAADIEKQLEQKDAPQPEQPVKTDAGQGQKNPVEIAEVSNTQFDAGVR